MSVLKELMLKDYVTLLGTMFGTGTIILSILGLLEGGNTNLIALGAMCWVFAMTCDLLDGLVARKLHQSNQIGREIDSLSDAVSFVAAPAVLILCASLNNEFALFLVPKEAVIIGIFVLVFGGIVRLAWFNVANVGEGYTGLTTPLSAGFLAIFYLQHHFFNQLNSVLPGYYSTFQPVSFFFSNTLSILILVSLMGVLNIAPFLKYGQNVQKRRGIWKWIILILAPLIAFTVIAGNLASASDFGPIILHFFPLAFWLCDIGYILYGFLNYLSPNKNSTVAATPE
ncbi:MAG: CDP-alcohol phosphatidyltransferase family protein [Candidatus Helarchaeota archaeon]